MIAYRLRLRDQARHGAQGSNLSPKLVILLFEDQALGFQFLQAAARGGGAAGLRQVHRADHGHDDHQRHQ